MSKDCAECRDGEHENYTDDVWLCVCTCPEERPYRAWLCADHREARADDGYTVKVLRQEAS